jgi:hypothetical protein
MNGVLADLIEATAGQEFQVALREAAAPVSVAGAGQSQETPEVSSGPAAEQEEEAPTAETPDP